MAGAIRPVLKGIYICDDVVISPDSKKPMIVNLFDRVRVPAATGFPHRLAKLCVFAWLRGGRGRVRFRIEIVNSQTGLQLGAARYYEFDFTDPIHSVHGKFMMNNIPFPEPGRYTVEFFCDDEFIDDQVIYFEESDGGT